MWLFCQCPAKMVRNAYEVRTKFVPNWCKICANYVQKSSPKCLNIRTVTVVVTIFERVSYEIHTNFVRISYEVGTICMNLYHSCAEQTDSAHSTRRSNTTTTQKNNKISSSATVTNEEQQTYKAQQAASKTTIPTQPKSRHYTHIMIIGSNKHKRRTVTNYKEHKSIVPDDSSSNRLSATRHSKAAHMQAKDGSGIPHADQAANVRDPRLPGCDALCQCTHGKDKISGWAGGPVCSCKNEKRTAQGKGSNLQSRTTAMGVTAAVPTTDSLHNNFNTAYRGSKRLSVAGQSKAAHMQAKDVLGIPHADQAANPYTSEC